jgi:hypothetical protein
MKTATVLVVIMVLAAAAGVWQWQRTRAPAPRPVTEQPVVQPPLAPGVVAVAPSDANTQVAIDNRAALQAAADLDNPHLPKPYADGLIVEHEQVEGNRLVTEIRIPDVGLDSLKQDMLATMQRQEQGDLIAAACKNKPLKALLQSKAELSRRFLDKDRKLIFEVVVSSADCAMAQ